MEEIYKKSFDFKLIKLTEKMTGEDWDYFFKFLNDFSKIIYERQLKHDRKSLT